jgi:glycosyltransferase involved in cell wall biosynthesis
MEGPGLPPGARARRLADAPLVSVVVASRAERTLLDACLGALLPQCSRLGAELVVARAGSTVDLEAAYPAATWIAAPADASLPALRAAGMAAAEGDVVALTEDHCLPAPDWLDRIVTAQPSGAAVVGGAMENARRDRAVDWAAYFAEYGTYLGEPPDGAAPSVAAANVAYRRSVVDDVIAAAREGHWENVAHDRLRARGHVIAFLRSAAVYENRRHRFIGFCRDRFAHGRDYAAVRLTEAGSGRRWLYFLGSPLLPFLLTGRVARAAGRSRLGPFVRALPLTFAFLTAWSAGEAVGYIGGPRRGGGIAHDPT